MLKIKPLQIFMNFYQQSNYKVGASENKLKLDTKLNINELFAKNYLINTSGKDIQVSIKISLFEKLIKS